MTAILLFQTLLCIGLLAVSLINLRFLKSIARREIPEDELPLISVCIPARNEAANIAACVRSLLHQDYPRYEILVLDDCSEDLTGRIVREIAEENPRVRLIQGRELPPGWVGKSHACHQLGQQAQGDYVFFTDADTVFKPGCLRYCAEVAAAKQCDLLTGCPRLIGVGFWERLSVPLIGATFMWTVPLKFLEDPRFPMAAAGSGAFLFFRREAYEAIGGHEAVKGEIVEDIEINQTLKHAGFTIGAADAALYVNCRMYESLPEIWEGMTKNLLAAVRLKGPLLGLMIALFWVIMLLPWVWFVFGPSWGWPFLTATLLPLIQIFSVVLGRYVSDRLVSRNDLLASLLMPLSCLFVTAIALRSWSRGILRQPTPWRGRNYAVWKDQKGELKGEDEAAR